MPNDNARTRRRFGELSLPDSPDFMPARFKDGF
jgi:hypothetical protein